MSRERELPCVIKHHTGGYVVTMVMGKLIGDVIVLLKVFASLILLLYVLSRPILLFFRTPVMRLIGNLSPSWKFEEARAAESGF